MGSREDVLSDFTIEEEMSPTVLKAYLQRYPEYTKDLLALFNQLSLSDLQSAEDVSNERIRSPHIQRDSNETE